MARTAMPTAPTNTSASNAVKAFSVQPERETAPPQRCAVPPNYSAKYPASAWPCAENDSSAIFTAPAPLETPW